MLGRLVLVTLAALAILALAAGSLYADIPNMSRFAIEETITPHARGGATGACSIVYYNLCRWLWLFSRFAEGDEVGVIFDLPLDCGKQPGETCMNTEFWWYWRSTCPVRGYTVSYGLYDLDAQGCKQGTAMGTLAHRDPTERWNHYPGLGGPVAADRVAVIASWDRGGFPYAATDNNVNDLGDPTHCPGYVPHTAAHSYAWKYWPQTYCPPSAFNDALGPVEIIMDASFTCEPVATEEESWSGVKKHFR